MFIVEAVNVLTVSIVFLTFTTESVALDFCFEQIKISDRSSSYNKLKASLIGRPAWQCDIAFVYATSIAEEFFPVAYPRRWSASQLRAQVDSFLTGNETVLIGFKRKEKSAFHFARAGLLRTESDGLEREVSRGIRFEWIEGQRFGANGRLTLPRIYFQSRVPHSTIQAEALCKQVGSQFGFAESSLVISDENGFPRDFSLVQSIGRLFNSINTGINQEQFADTLVCYCGAKKRICAPGDGAGLLK